MKRWIFAACWTAILCLGCHSEPDPVGLTSVPDDSSPSSSGSSTGSYGSTSSSGSKGTSSGCSSCSYYTAQIRNTQSSIDDDRKMIEQFQRNNAKPATIQSLKSQLAAHQNLLTTLQYKASDCGCR